MRSRNRVPLIIFLAVVAALAILFFIRRSTQAAFGPAVTLCPGPDSYGYTCAPGSQFAYIDATDDTFLYVDDGTAIIDLPFPFIFYGTTYTEATLSSNGNVQFGNANGTFFNDCLESGPVPGLGDMIAPYWDDLNLSFSGFLETELVGEAPNRVFVIEWDDVPRYGEDPDDRVTFEIQLIEDSNDIVFLYQDVRTFVSDKGSSATVGLQSENQGLALQFSCHQPVLADGSGLSFPHPAQPNGEIGQETAVSPSQLANPLAVKGIAVELMAALTNSQPNTLNQLKAHWLSQQPQRLMVWQDLDVSGDAQSELALLWRGTPQNPELAQVAVISLDENRQPTLLLDQMLSSRKTAFGQPEIVALADLTEDGRTDLLILDKASGRLQVLISGETVQLVPVPEICQGSLIVTDTNEDGRTEIVRDKCDLTLGRVSYQWDGRQFRMSR